MPWLLRMAGFGSLDRMARSGIAMTRGGVSTKSTPVELFAWRLVPIQFSGASVCPNAPCQAQGPQVPAGMRLVVEYANATVVTPHGQGFYSVGLTYKGTLGSLLFPATYVSTIGSQDTYTVNANLVQYVEAGDTPGLVVAAPPGSGIFATGLSAATSSI